MELAAGALKDVSGMVGKPPRGKRKAA